MDTDTLRERYLTYFETLGHRRLPSASLTPENDPTALFTSAGMQPLVPYLLGEPHPLGRRLVNAQRCLRTNDIDEVGDASHLTFFEMLGNWSLGDYFKTESLAWSHTFLIRELGLDPARLAVTAFAGDDRAPRDTESADQWRRLGLPAERIFFLPREDNWWGPVGQAGPCGPDSEIFFDTGRPDHPGCRPGCGCGRWLEIWNNVFMAYNQLPDGRLERLPQRNVDTGMGIERTVAVLQGLDDIYRIDTLWPLIQAVEQRCGRSYAESPAAFRIIVDHVRAAVFALADGVRPGNVEAGYVVRRMLRRAIRHGRDLGLTQNFCADLGRTVVDRYASTQPHLVAQAATLAENLDREESRFKATLERGLREVARAVEQERAKGQTRLSGEVAFNLYESFGFPLPLTVELAREQGLSVDESGFAVCLEAHRARSRVGSERKFRGGLAERTEPTTRLHTATHLLHAALRAVLGEHVRQLGSNITHERLRFDFAHPRKVAPEELAQIEALVNAQIAADLPVRVDVMTCEAAVAMGALAFFGDKYGEQVKVYQIGAFSREVCGGPHVDHTGELGRFTITREEAVGEGVRRIKATLNAASSPMT